MYITIDNEVTTVTVSDTASACATDAISAYKFRVG